MKPSQRIFQIVKELATEEAKRRGGYFGWKGLEDLSKVIASEEFHDIFPAAVLKYLDEKYSSSTQLNKHRERNGMNLICKIFGHDVNEIMILMAEIELKAERRGNNIKPSLVCRRCKLELLKTKE